MNIFATHHRGQTIEDAQAAMRARILAKKTERMRYRAQGHHKAVLLSPEQRKAASQARADARNITLSNERNKTFFAALGITESSTQLAALRMKDVFVPLILSRLSQDGFIPAEQITSQIF